jgi:hypothetical protein
MAFHHSPKVVTDNLIFLVDAADKNSYPGSGTTWTDLSSSGNNGTLSAEAIGTVSGSLNTMAFSGTGDYISTSAVTVGGLHTYSCWAKSDYNERQAIFGHGSNVKGSFYPWFTADRPLLHFKSDCFRYWVAQTKTYDGNWHHYAVVVNFSDVTACKLYIDGVLIDVYTSNETTYLAYSQGLTIGAYQNTSGGGAQLFQGDISNFKVYNIELSAKEVSQNFNAQRSRFGV